MSAPPVFDVPLEAVRIGINQAFEINIGFVSPGDAGIYAEGISAASFGMSDPDRMHLYADGADFWPTLEDVGTHALTVWAIDGNGTRHTASFTVIVEENCTNKAWYPDTDGDGYGNGKVHAQLSCSPWEGLVDNTDNCGSNETASVWYADVDADGWGDTSNAFMACSQPPGYVESSGDCNDHNPDINPEAYDYPDDGIDSNCDDIDPIADDDGDGVSDTYDNCPGYYNPAQEDQDEDGEGDICDDDIDGDGLENQNDCDPYDANTGAQITSFPDWDGDGYGDPNQPFAYCIIPEDYVENNEDCNDQDAAINPAAPELPADGIDNNCNGQIDESTQNLAPQISMSGDFVKNNYYEVGTEYRYTITIMDPDADEVTLSVRSEYAYMKSLLETAEFSPALPATDQGMLTVEMRWTPTPDQIHEQIFEFIATDEAGNQTTKMLFWNPYILPVLDVPQEPVRIGINQDFSIAINYKQAGKIWSDGWVSAPFGEVAPDDLTLRGYYDTFWATAEDVGTHYLQVFSIDETTGIMVTDTVVVVVEANCSNKKWYLDKDGDGYGSGAVQQITCSAWPGMVDNNEDCNDQNAAIHPAAAEISGDGLDNNCNGIVDEDGRAFALQEVSAIVVGVNRSFEIIVPAVDPTIHQLVEGGFRLGTPEWLHMELISLSGSGVANALRVWGTPPPKSYGTYTPTVWATSSTGTYDGQLLNIRVGNCSHQLWYKDADGDGFGGEESVALEACWQPEGFVDRSGDCNDSDATIYPGATELADGIDNDCSGTVDDGGSCFATHVVSFRQGFRPDGGVIGMPRSNPDNALGAPQENPNYNFVSLGFGGELVLELGSLLYENGTSAPDLMVVETTWGWAWRSCYEGELAGNPETMVMDVSANGEDWVRVPGEYCRNVKVDLSAVVGEGKLPYVRYIRITDTSNPEDFHPSSNGYDVDGIITCPSLFEEEQTNSRKVVAGSFNPNFFNEVAEEEEELQSFSYYPNPVKDVLNIKTGGLAAQAYQLELYSLQGVLLYKGTHQTEAATTMLSLQMQDLQQGVYLLRIKAAGLQQNLRIIKE